MLQCRDPQQHEITKNCYEQMACQQLLWQHSLCFVVLRCPVLRWVVLCPSNCLVQLQHYCYSLCISTGTYFSKILCRRRRDRFISICVFAEVLDTAPRGRHQPWWKMQICVILMMIIIGVSCLILICLLSVCVLHVRVVAIALLSVGW